MWNGFVAEKAKSGSTAAYRVQELLNIFRYEMYGIGNSKTRQAWCRITNSTHFLLSVTVNDVLREFLRSRYLDALHVYRRIRRIAKLFRAQRVKNITLVLLLISKPVWHAFTNQHKFLPKDNSLQSNSLSAVGKGPLIRRCLYHGIVKNSFGLNLAGVGRQAWLEIAQYRNPVIRGVLRVAVGNCRRAERPPWWRDLCFPSSGLNTIQFMSNTNLIRILLACSFCLFLPTTTFATSGACSDHGGVNCSVYDSSNGAAVCNDGSDSSVAYSAMVECQQTGTYSCSSLAPDCDPSAYDVLISQAEGDAGGQAVSAGMAGTPEASQMINNAAEPYIEAKAACQARVGLYQNCLTGQQKLLQQEQQEVSNMQQRANNLWCQAHWGLTNGSSYYDSQIGQCRQTCNSGYVFNGWQLENGSCTRHATWQECSDKYV